jgi:hypothetical protein
MWRKGLLVLAVVSLAIAGCGGDDDNDDRGEEARQVVIDTIVAFEAGDYQAMCDLQNERVNTSIAEITKTDTCPEGYEKLFSNQKEFGGVGATSATPFDDFVEQLGDYEVGEATLSEEDGTLQGEVALDGPEEALSLVVEEDGEMKVSELFVTPEANTPSTGLGG